MRHSRLPPPHETRCRLLCLLAGCHCRSLLPGLLRHPRLLAGFHCRRLHPRLLQGCCLRLRLSDHLRLLPDFRLRRLRRLRRLHRFRPLPLSPPPSTPATGLLMPPPPPPAAELPPPLPPPSAWLPFLPCNCLCILQAQQRTNVRPLCSGSEKQTRTICRAKSKPFRLATMDDSAAARKSLS